MNKRQCLLVVLDGYGLQPPSPDNAVENAQSPFLHALHQREGNIAILQASGASVGLPEGQIGNSEVGHLHLGSGKIVFQGLSLIDKKLWEPNLFERNPTLQKALKHIQDKRGAVHLIGLLSPGGVHSHERHLIQFIEKLLPYLSTSQQIWVHALLDGRDTPPHSAKASIQAFENHFEGKGVKIATISGRFYGMDRDQRWERTEKAYRTIVKGEAFFKSKNALEALQQAYDRGESDEFCEPTVCGVCPRMGPDDSIFFMNFRADRARQLSVALANFEKNFRDFKVENPEEMPIFWSLTEYDKRLHEVAIFPQIILNDGLGAILSQKRLRQLRVSETEKFAHVTYFFNGNRSEPWPGENRNLIDSDRTVKTYDQAPAMKALAIQEAVIQGIEAKYDFILCNFANPDMVGHTGNYEATKHAIEAVDNCLKSICEVAKKFDYEVFITSDHGNAETMGDAKTGEIRTAHTNHPVPFYHVGSYPAILKKEGSLIDVAPTILQTMGLEIPSGMQGLTLWQFA